MGETVWKILLQLVIASEKGHRVTSSDISGKLLLSEATTHRYLKILENSGYITLSQPADSDSNKQLHFTRHGRSIIRNTLLAMKDELSQWYSGHPTYV